MIAHGSFLIAILLCAIMSGCGGSNSAIVSQNSSAPYNLSKDSNSAVSSATSSSNSSIASETYRVISQNSLTNSITDVKNLTIRDQETWGQLWNQFNANTSRVPAIPAVDFQTEMILAIFSSAAPNPCYSLIIDSVQQIADQTKITYHISAPNSDVVCSQVVVYPSMIIAVPKTSGDASFIKSM